MMIKKLLIILILFSLTGCSQNIGAELPILEETNVDIEKTEKEATYFAEIDKDGIVLRVIVADQEFINTGAVGDPKNWIQTYKDGIRKNYAGKGYKYDKDKDYFISKKPSEDAILDEVTAKWILPIKEPIINIATSTIATSTKE